MRLSILTLLAFLVLGCAGPGASSTLTEREQSIDQWMRERYDLKALSAFLAKEFDRRRAVDGIYFFGLKLDSDWVIERVDLPYRLRSGAWVMWDANQGDEQFDVYAFCDRDQSTVVNFTMPEDRS